MTRELDAIDRTLLDLLRKNGRMSYSDLAKHIGISRVAVRDRIDGMVRDGVIEGFTAVVSAEKLGLRVSAAVEVEVEPPRLEEAAATFCQLEDVATVYQKTGASVLHLHVVVRDNQSLERFLYGHVYPVKGVVRVNTEIVIRRFKSESGIRI